MSTLLVAQAGGHLQELYRLRPRFQGLDGEDIWVTVDTPQSRSLLAEHDAIFVRGAKPHDLLTTVRNLVVARRTIKAHHLDQIVSTGSSIAVSFIPLARIHGTNCHYIESATRVYGPSMTGRILQFVPGTHLYTQNTNWLRQRWRDCGSVFDGFSTKTIDPGPPTALRVVVTVGSSVFGFRSLITRLIQILPRDAEVLWQTGVTDVSNLGIATRESVPGAELQMAVAEADVVIGHAGVGTALVALEAGKWPILIPRRRSRNEHIDDHQVEVGSILARAGLALIREIDELAPEDLIQAARRRVVDSGTPPPFNLVQPR